MDTFREYHTCIIKYSLDNIKGKLPSGHMFKWTGIKSYIDSVNILYSKGYLDEDVFNEVMLSDECYLPVIREFPRNSSVRSINQWLKIK